MDASADTTQAHSLNHVYPQLRRKPGHRLFEKPLLRSTLPDVSKARAARV
jgi:hypothetical protein